MRQGIGDHSSLWTSNSNSLWQSITRGSRQGEGEPIEMSTRTADVEARPSAGVEAGKEGRIEAGQLVKSRGMQLAMEMPSKEEALLHGAVDTPMRVRELARQSLHACACMHGREA